MFFKTFNDKYKQYTLYLTITYLFNFGFNDGITIKYGGGDLNEIDRQEVRKQKVVQWLR